MSLQRLQQSYSHRGEGACDGEGQLRCAQEEKVSSGWKPKEDEGPRSTAPKPFAGGCNPPPLDLPWLVLLGLGRDPGVRPSATSFGRNTGTKVSLRFPCPSRGLPPSHLTVRYSADHLKRPSGGVKAPCSLDTGESWSWPQLKWVCNGKPRGEGKEVGRGHEIWLLAPTLAFWYIYPIHMGIYTPYKCCLDRTRGFETFPGGFWHLG